MKACEIDSSKEPFIFGVSTGHCHENKRFNLQWTLHGSEMDS